MVIGLVFTGLVLAVDLGRRAPVPPEPRAQWPVASGAVPVGDLVVQARGQIPMPANTPAAHASSLLAMPAGHPSVLMAFWFAGSRESGPDVQIAASHFDRASQQWSAARFVVNRTQGGQRPGYGVRRLGNPVAWLDAQSKIHLFVVATGMGGWAAGRILHLKQVDDGHDFSRLEFRAQRVLPLSWLWNTSFLVRAMPLALSDDGMVLPAYFELGAKYPVALRFDGAGEFRGMVRISGRRHLLQPTLLMRTPTDWLALMRDSGPDKKIKAAQTLDGGRSWSDLSDLPLYNPDAAIAGLGLGPASMVLTHNALPDSRGVLDLSFSSDGLRWTRQHTLVRGDAASEYSYPAMAWADGSLWISYTDQRRAIAWQRLAAPVARR